MKKYYLKDLKELRDLKLMTNTELAEAANIGEDTLYRAFRGTPISFKTAKSIANALKVNVGKDEIGIYFHEDSTNSIYELHKNKRKTDNILYMNEIIDITIKLQDEDRRKIYEIIGICFK